MTVGASLGNMRVHAFWLAGSFLWTREPKGVLTKVVGNTIPAPKDTYAISESWLLPIGGQLLTHIFPPLVLVRIVDAGAFVSLQPEPKPIDISLQT